MAPLFNAASYCFHNVAIGCDFWTTVCNGNSICAGLHAGLTAAHSSKELGKVFDPYPSPWTLRILDQVVHNCADITSCQRTVAICAIIEGTQCVDCLTDFAILSPHDRAFCAAYFQEYEIDASCAPCPSSVATINAVVWATSAVGAVSAVLCLAVALTIIAHGRDRVSIRERMVVGMTLANVGFSTANVIPLNALQTGVITCGRYALPFTSVRAGRAWWFCGKYGLLAFEMVVVATSLLAIRRGHLDLPRWVEGCLHAGCVAVGAVAFAIFYVLGGRAIAHGYNADMEELEQTGAYSHPNLNDDADDTTTFITASGEYGAGRAEYDGLVQQMLLVWNGLLAVTFLCWVGLRLLFHRVNLALRKMARSLDQDEAADEWADTRRSTWAARRRGLESQRSVFIEIAGPLEPYVVVLLVFGLPAAVMSTSFCQSHSQAKVQGENSLLVEGGSHAVSYGTCDVWCEFALSFRSAAMVTVYLMSQRRRHEFLRGRKTCQLLKSRVTGWFSAERRMEYAALVGTNRIEQSEEMIELMPTSESRAPSPAPLQTFTDGDMVRKRLLGEGCFGEVWAGRMICDNSPVAIKILRLGGVDEDGDLIHPEVAEEFRSECQMLQRLDSPHLIAIYGSGTTDDGRCFMVTEMMPLGSLHDALHDPQRAMPWRLRVSIGLQTALGMEYLHQRDVLHRDLKSPNVVLNHHYHAKLCDFGLARVLPTRHSSVITSSFTGTARVAPPAALDHWGLPSPTQARPTASSHVGLKSALTKATGTFQWMAPEMFRGDVDYTKAVDVYSFGVVLWELATRETPWNVEFTAIESEASMFTVLNEALQRGKRPELPPTVRESQPEFVAVLTQCWAGDPADRPAFSAVTGRLAHALRLQSTLEATNRQKDPGPPV